MRGLAGMIRAVHAALDARAKPGRMQFSRMNRNVFTGFALTVQRIEWKGAAVFRIAEGAKSAHRRMPGNRITLDVEPGRNASAGEHA